MPSSMDTPLKRSATASAGGLRQISWIPCLTRKSRSLPIFFAGGVSKNGSCVRHLEDILEYRSYRIHIRICMGAIGACYSLLAGKTGCSRNRLSLHWMIFSWLMISTKLISSPSSIEPTRVPRFHQSRDHHFYTCRLPASSRCAG